MARGVPKNLTQEQRDALAQRMREYHQRKAAAKAEAAEAPPPSDAGDNAPACPECSATGPHYQTCSSGE